MEVNLNVPEFQRFRHAHAQANNFLLGGLLVLGLIIGLIRWLLDIDSAPLFSREFVISIILFMGLGLSIPRMGYHLARQIVGSWYRKEFGQNYREYRKNEKVVVAILLLESET